MKLEGPCQIMKSVQQIYMCMNKLKVLVVNKSTSIKLDTGLWNLLCIYSMNILRLLQVYFMKISHLSIVQQWFAFVFCQYSCSYLKRCVVILEFGSTVFCSLARQIRQGLQRTNPLLSVQLTRLQTVAPSPNDRLVVKTKCCMGEQLLLYHKSSWVT